MCLLTLIKDGSAWNELLTGAKICVPTRGNFPVTLYYLLADRKGLDEYLWGTSGLSVVNLFSSGEFILAVIPFIGYL